MSPSKSMPKKFRIRPSPRYRLTTRYSRGNGRLSRVCALEDSVSTSWFLPSCIEYSRFNTRIIEGEAKRNKRDMQTALLEHKIKSVKYPMHELELNYPATKGKTYTEEEDRYLLCRLEHYGLHKDDLFDLIKKDIMDYPVFRFDWFIKSRSTQELQRRCTTLLGMIEKEAETTMPALVATMKGKVRHSQTHCTNSVD